MTPKCWLYPGSEHDANSEASVYCNVLPRNPLRLVCAQENDHVRNIGRLPQSRPRRPLAHFRDNCRVTEIGRSLSSSDYTRADCIDVDTKVSDQYRSETDEGL